MAHQRQIVEGNNSKKSIDRNFIGLVRNFQVNADVTDDCTAFFQTSRQMLTTKRRSYQEYFFLSCPPRNCPLTRVVLVMRMIMVTMLGSTITCGPRSCHVGARWRFFLGYGLTPHQVV